ncbi:uncharacterized protein BJX67DRAFT_368382 [Aspergillus lucknowensis]|uniref:Uncharacterized protein n=1 Tax=Aspergillus lucknowensis TaxID=176173 RepID=A0ABR4L658_9EURO
MNTMMRQTLRSLQTLSGSRTGSTKPGSCNRSQAYPFRLTPASSTGSGLEPPGNIYAGVAILFPELPMELLVYKWQLLRNTSRYACASGYIPLLQQIAHDNDSPYILSAQVDGMVRARIEVPSRYSSFLHLRKWLKRGDEYMALHDHDPNQRRATVTLDRMWHDDSMEFG